VLASLPSQWISLKDAAERMGCDPRTVTSMIERNEIIGRRAGRRVLVDASSLRPKSREEISTLAAAARGSR
jgi:excisionase family DNA binding protein